MPRQIPVEMSDRQRPARRPIFGALANLLIVCACGYLITRAVLLAGSQPGPLGSVLAVLLLLSEAFVLFQSVAYALDVCGVLPDRGVPRKDIADWAKAPSVAVLVPARHEPRDVLDATLTCLENLDYPNKTIYFLDDSTDERYRKEAEELAKAHGVVLFRRQVRHGAKAGVLNDCIKELDAKYVAVFDADQNPVPGFLKDIVPILEANDRLAFVQTPQFYTNIDSSPVAFAANLQHCMFYEYICEGKGAAGAMICCGTNMVIRREALLAVGGFDELSVTEDFSTSVDLLTQGWQGHYHGHVCAFGEGPESLLPYLKQQWRWSRGNLGVLKKILRYIVTRPFSMRPRQWWEFLGTGSYYLIGWAYFFLLLCPISYVILRVPSFFMDPAVYLLTFVPYFSLSVAIFYAGMERRSYKPLKLFKAILLGFTAMPVYMSAAVSALFGLKATFGVTQKGKGSAEPPLWFFWPQVGLWLLNWVGLVWGVNYLLIDFKWSVVMSMVWIAYHFLLFSGLFYFRGTTEAAADGAIQAA